MKDIVPLENFMRNSEREIVTMLCSDPIVISCTAAFDVATLFNSWLFYQVKKEFVNAAIIKASAMNKPLPKHIGDILVALSE